MTAAPAVDRPIRFARQSNPAVGQQLGDMVLAPVVGFDPRPRLESPGLHGVLQCDAPLSPADGRPASARSLRRTTWLEENLRVRMTAQAASVRPASKGR